MIKSYELMIYPRKLFVSVGYDEDEIRSSFVESDGKALSFEDIDIDLIDGLTVTEVKEVKGRDLGVLIIIKDPEDLSVLVHESAHAANSICEQFGMKIQPDNDESYCYLIQFIFKCVNEAVYCRDAYQE